GGESHKQATMRGIAGVKMQFRERLTVDTTAGEPFRKIFVWHFIARDHNRLHAPIRDESAETAARATVNTLCESVETFGIKRAHAADMGAVISILDEIGGGKLNKRGDKLRHIAVNLFKFRHQLLGGDE